MLAFTLLNCLFENFGGENLRCLRVIQRLNCIFENFGGKLEMFVCNSAFYLLNCVFGNFGGENLRCLCVTQPH